MARLRNQRTEAFSFRKACEAAKPYIERTRPDRSVEGMGQWLDEMRTFGRVCHDLGVEPSAVYEYFGVSKFGYMDR